MTKPPLLFRICNAVRVGFQFHGIWLPFVALHRLWIYTFRKIFASRTFTFAGKRHYYWIHPFTLNNERTVEVALARDFLHDQSASVLEVGNVLANYFSFPRDVVDKYEVAPGVLNEDIVSFSPGKKYDFIVTLSTLEHVGWDETPREPEKIIRAIARLKELLNDHGKLMVTLPLGYNACVDELVRMEKTGFTEVRYLKRTTTTNQWREARLEEVIGSSYDSPFPCANAIFVGYFRKDDK